MMKFDPDDPRLTAYALGELNEADRRAFKLQLKESKQGRGLIGEIRDTAALLSQELNNEPCPKLSEVNQMSIETELGGLRRKPKSFPWVAVGVAASLLVAIGLYMVLDDGPPEIVQNPSGQGTEKTTPKEDRASDPMEIPRPDMDIPAPDSMQPLEDMTADNSVSGPAGPDRDPASELVFGATDSVARE